MTITRVGSTEKYADGWEAAFGKTKRSTKKAKRATTKKATAKKSAKSKTTAKKKSTKKR